MIETNRFYLRKLSIDDATDNYLSWFDTDNSQLYITYSKNLNSLNSLKKYITEKNDDKFTLFLGIFDKITNDHVGNIKFEPIDVKNNYTILGVLIGNPKYRGIGVFPEVIDAITPLLKNKFSIKKILLGVSKLNIAAMKAYIKAGFVEVNQSQFIEKKSIDSVIMEKIL
jgi:ribosomal-protein-alanine N-acetyltransferase